MQYVSWRPEEYLDKGEVVVKGNLKKQGESFETFSVAKDRHYWRSLVNVANSFYYGVRSFDFLSAY
jgi:hypothetical protein